MIAQWLFIHHSGCHTRRLLKIDSTSLGIFRVVAQGISPLKTSGTYRDVWTLEAHSLCS